MHEMALVGNVVDIVVEHATVAQAKEVISVKLRIGELRDIVDDMMEKCFRYVAHGTVAENSILIIEKVPIVLCCNECNTTLHMKLHTAQSTQTICSKCGKSNFKILQGKELYVEDIEII
ncbi:hydrogenase maturation nickel metallochaperone HypA [Anaeromicropila herbilytica]|uniref:Hydrogenase maturation factor HypA n=1 Tax=Anaeromicropila herbilytica TaxID=2785025 RepID=A0A7R7IDD8_9FIRM|nr:hydrogenase maturation nickel metallochaperone HypA [Anaeromicropila herbilytica]BCN31638.1 putative hydrogenase nickel incorporation protein HypA 2 [Anaeromicropila herbilytica]